MNWNKILLIITCWISMSIPAHGQYENVWAFGSRAGLDFNNITNGIPTPFRTNQGSESGVSICDDNGNLLFYTNGSIVWDRYHSVMPNGANITGMSVSSFDATQSSMMGAVIFPFPNDDKRYYIFSVISRSGGAPTPDDEGKLFYSVVDMELNNRMGDIDLNNSGILVDTGLMESIIVVPGNHCDYWVIGTTYYFKRPYNPYIDTIPEFYEASFKAYQVTREGVNATPSTSLSIPVPLGWTRGSLTSVLKSSHDHNKIAIPYSPRLVNPGNSIWAPGAGFRLFDFDRSSGMLNSELLISDSALHFAHNICFSPDNTKLYVSSWEITNTDTFSIISQFDISSTNVNIIKNSRSVVYRRQNDDYLGYNPMKIGPDGKLYISHYPTHSMSVIPSPNMSPPSCGLWEDTINFSTVPGIGNYLGYVLSNHLGLPDPFGDSLYNTIEVCGYSPLTPTDTTGSKYTWNDGLRGNIRTATRPGKYWVSYETPCTFHVDTFVVNTGKTSSHTEVICDYEFFEFGGQPLAETGTYKDTLVAVNGCDSVVTLNLITLTRPEINLLTPQESNLCMGDSISIQASGASRYQWFANGLTLGREATQEVVLAHQLNHLSVIGIADNECRDTVILDVIAEACCDFFIPNAFSPNQDGVNDGFAPVLKNGGHIRNYQLQIFNRLGQQVYSSFNVTEAWDGTYGGTPADAGVYFYYITARCLEGTEIVHKGDLTLIR